MLATGDEACVRVRALASAADYILAEHCATSRTSRLSRWPAHSTPYSQPSVPRCRRQRRPLLRLPCHSSSARYSAISQGEITSSVITTAAAITMPVAMVPVMMPARLARLSIIIAKRVGSSRHRLHRILPPLPWLWPRLQSAPLPSQ